MIYVSYVKYFVTFFKILLFIFTIIYLHNLRLLQAVMINATKSQRQKSHGKFRVICKSVLFKL